MTDLTALADRLVHMSNDRWRYSEDRKTLAKAASVLRLAAQSQSGGDTTIPSSENMEARFAWLEAKAIDMGYVLVPATRALSQAKNKEG